MHYLKQFMLPVLLLAFSSSYAQQAHSKLQIERLTDSFFVYTTWVQLPEGPFPSNSMYLITKEGAVLFDTPWDTTQFQPLLDTIWSRHHKKALLCIPTHFHDDRTAGLQYFQNHGIATLSSELTRELCIKEGNPAAAAVFTKDTSITIGGYRFQTYYPGKGHAPDNIVIWFPNQKILYGGCFIKSTESGGLGNLSDADPAAWLLSVERTMKDFPKRSYTITGHQNWRDNKGLQHTKKLLKKALKGKKKG